MLQDTDENVRPGAVQVLGAQGREALAFEHLITVLWKPYWKVRRAIVQVLKAQGERVPLDVLLPMLQDTDWKVRQAAIEVLKAKGERVPLGFAPSASGYRLEGEMDRCPGLRAKGRARSSRCLAPPCFRIPIGR